MAAADAILSSLQRPRVVFRSTITPDFAYDPLAPAPPQEGGGAGAWLMGLLKPAVYVDGPAGSVVSIEPYGRPTESYGWVVAAAAAGAAVGVGWVLWRAFVR